MDGSKEKEDCVSYKTGGLEVGEDDGNGVTSPKHLADDADENDALPAKSIIEDDVDARADDTFATDGDDSGFVRRQLDVIDEQRNVIPDKSTALNVNTTDVKYADFDNGHNYLQSHPSNFPLWSAERKAAFNAERRVARRDAFQRERDQFKGLLDQCRRHSV